jgi:hypothetical protein
MFGPHAIGTERFATVSSGTSLPQVAGAILGEQACVQNPDKDAVARARTIVPCTGQLRFLSVGGWGPSAAEVAAAPPPVDLGPELALELHEAPDLGAVRAEVGLDVGGRLANRCQVDAEQFRAPLQRPRDRPAHVQVVPKVVGPSRSRLAGPARRAPSSVQAC